MSLLLDAPYPLLGCAASFNVGFGRRERGRLAEAGLMRGAGGNSTELSF